MYDVKSEVQKWREKGVKIMNIFTQSKAMTRAQRNPQKKKIVKQ